MYTYNIEWHDSRQQLDILRQEALHTVPGYNVKISFDKNMPLGTLVAHKNGAGEIIVNPLPMRRQDSGFRKPVPMMRTRNGQWNLARAIIRHHLRHYRFTTQHSAKEGTQLAYLVEALEDARIERWEDPFDPAAADLFRIAGHVFYREAVQAAAKHRMGTQAYDTNDLLMQACLWWRWGVSRVSDKKFKKAIFNNDAGQLDLWAKIKPEVEAAWVAKDTAEVQVHAENILKILGVDPEEQSEQPQDGEGRDENDPNGIGNPMGGGIGDGQQQPQEARAATEEGMSEEEMQSPSPAETGEEISDKEGEADDTDLEESRETDLLMPSPDIAVPHDGEMNPQPYEMLADSAKPLADQMLVIPAEKKRKRSHPERGTYSFRQEWRDSERPNREEYVVPGGKRRAIDLVIDGTGSNSGRTESIRLAAMSLFLAAQRDRHSLEILVTRKSADPHYTVITEHGAKDVEASCSRIAGINFEGGTEYLAWGMRAGAKSLLKQKNPLKELLVMTDCELKSSLDDPRQSKEFLANVPSGIRVTGVLLVNRGGHNTDPALGYMREYFKDHRLLVCTAEELPEALNAALMH